MWWESFAQSLQCVVSSTSCARRPRGVVRLRSPMVLSTHGSGRARGEREEQKAWAVAQSLQCVVSSTSCARRPRGVVRLRSPMVLSTHSKPGNKIYGRSTSFEGYALSVERSTHVTEENHARRLLARTCFPSQNWRGFRFARRNL